MIKLTNDRLAFLFPETHPRARLEVTFQRTLRIPDDGKTYPLPPGLGAFPVRHVDDFAATVPGSWLEHGGVMLPMFQSEAMWLYFTAAFDPERMARYPLAIKVATGKIDAVTGQSWSDGLLHRRPQDYMVAPQQPWLDGYCVAKGMIRQFVAMPLGAGYTAEEQITGSAEYGGLQIIVYPMKREVFERRFPRVERQIFSAKSGSFSFRPLGAAMASCEMGLAAGGRMKQEIYQDVYDFEDWDVSQSSRCFIHIGNSLSWRAITKQQPPHLPPTAAEYTRHGLPWFDYYDDSLRATAGSDVLAKLKSVLALGKEKRAFPLPENESCAPNNVEELPKERVGNQVREGTF